MTRYTSSSTTPTSYTATTFGCDSFERLALEQDALARGARGRVHELDRDAPLELGIVRAPHDAHAALAHALEQVIAAELPALVGREQRVRDLRAGDRSRAGVTDRALTEGRTLRLRERRVVVRIHPGARVARYYRAMRLTLLVLAGVACGKPEPMPPKRPNTELIIGEFARRPPTGTTAARFRGDGSVTLASKAEELDTKPIATGRFQLDGDQLTLTYTTGEMCEPGEKGVYTVVISRIGIRFTKVDDPCERRSRMDGETWFRIK